MRFLLGALVALAMSAPADAQRPTFRLAAGMGTLAAGDFGAGYDGQVAFYQESGVPITPQRRFPASWTAEAEALYPVGALDLGLRGQMLTTTAETLYGDFAGTLDLRARLRAVFVEPQVGVRRPVGRGLTVGLAAHAGVAFLNAQTVEAVQISYAPFERAWAAATEAKGLGLSLGLSATLAVPAGPADVSLRVGGRWAHVDATPSVSGLSPSIPTPEPVDHDLSGLSLTVGLAF